MLKGLSTGLKIALVVQFVIALLFLLLGWSHTSSLQFGRTPSLPDMIALASPLVFVIAGGLLAASSARRGQQGQAQVFALVPIPLAILLAMLAGMV
jgi:cytochrome bd-type quinol oxidase subunit 2